MMKLTLIRGLPGSGKSTLAQQQAAIHFEADMFFIKNNVYCYDPTLLNQAHQWCEQQTAQALQQGKAVVVSNTFIKWWQIKPYIYLAKQYNVPVKLIEATGQYPNIHAVPAETITAMKTRYESNESIVAKIKKLLPVAQLCL
jgi:predicted kinase